jgi:phenylalanyl-tRNA synthetase alpha chain
MTAYHAAQKKQIAYSACINIRREIMIEVPDSCKEGVNMKTLTITQIQRLSELNAPNEIISKDFEDVNSRDLYFKGIELELSRNNKIKLQKFIDEEHIPLVNKIENNLKDWLMSEEGFSQVNTPIILPKNMLEKMSITEDHPLTKQVFWLDQKRCLRPMLAPNLYSLMRDLYKLTKQPVRIFEVGPCFRKETQGARHMNEFTMLNLVEMAGCKDGEQNARLRELAASAMKAIGFENYQIEETESEVYGETLDIVSGDIELASCATGPHPLDAHWGVFENWVGIGFGIERIALAMGGYENIKRVGRSLSYLDGSRLNV